MNDYKFHKIFFCLVLLIVKFSVPCHAQSQSFTAEAEEDTIAEYLPADSLFARYLREQGVAIINNNELKLLPSGREKFNDLFEEIKKAKHHIHLEYFNFRNDSIGNALFDLLALKVKEGVKVRAMFDAFGNMSNNRPLRNRLLKKLSKRGIEIITFDPITFPYVNHAASRDHQK